MALPGDIESVQVTGTFVDPAGQAQRGWVSFTPSAILTDVTDSVVIAPLPRTCEVAGGALTSPPLAATDNTLLLPGGWFYTVQVALQNVPPYSFAAFIAYENGATQDISTLVPLEPVPAMAGFLPFSGGQMTGPLYASEAPVSETEVATKGYVDATAAGLSAKPSVQEATTAALPVNTYSGTAQTLTANFAGALTVDGISVSLGDRILVKQEAAPANNGIYTVTTLGTSMEPYVLTRAADMDTGAQVPGACAYVEQGTVNAGSGWIVAGTGPYTLGTTAIAWTQFTGAGEITGGTGISVAGNTVGLSVPVAVSSGGTGASTAGQNDVLAGPASGGTGAPSFRALVSGDIPNNAANTSGTAAGLSATLAVGSGGTGSTTQNWQGLLTPVSVTQSSGTYPASAGSLVKANIAGGSWTVDLPSAPAANAIVGAKVIANATGNANTLTVACSGSDKFETSTGGTTTTLFLANQAAAWQYNGGYWTRISDDLPLAQLGARYANVFSPMAYGAAGDGTANDTTAVQAAYTAAAAANGVVDITGRKFLCTSPITLSSYTTTRGGNIGAGGTPGQIVNNTTDLFSVTGTVVGVAFEGGYYSASAGHVFNAGTAGCAFWTFRNATLAQGGNYCLWYMSGAGLYLDIDVGEGCTLIGYSGATTSPWYVSVSSNGANSSRWHNCRISNSSNSNVPFFHLESTAAGYADNNSFRDITAEQCPAGIITALSAAHLTIENVVGYDVTTYTGHIFNIGQGSGSGLNSRIVSIRSSGWTGGALGGGVYDVSAPSVAALVVENTGPQSTGYTPVYNIPASAAVLWGGVYVGGTTTTFVPRAAGTSSPAAPLPYFNPKDDGAVFNGSTDDSADLNATITRGGTIVFPPGTTEVHANELAFSTSSLHVRGSGMYDTIVQCTNGSLSTLWVYGSSFVTNVELSDMTLDGTGVGASAVAQLGNRLDRLRIRRCRFINWPSVIIQGGYAAEIIIEDCEADGAGLGLGTFFLSTNRQNESVIIRRNRLRWLNTGITIGSGSPAGAQYHSAYIDICDNYIDLGWWLLKTVSSNSGGTVTYGASTVTDSSAPFGATNSIAAGTTIRVLSPLQTGTLTTIGTQVTDSSGNFTTANVWRGHIVRSGTAFGVVSKVESATQLHVEEWLSQTTYQPVTPPSSASYTAYGVVLGATVSNTSTAITVGHGGGGLGGGWYDLQGNSVTPSSGTLYEVLPANPVYPIFCNVPTEKVKICRNTVRRGWGDNIEFFGSRGIITGNIVEDGQDEGIVAEGYSTTYPGVKTVISNNICRHNGTSGLILINQADCEVGPNQLEDNTWGAPSSYNLGQLELANCVNTTVTGGRATNSGESAINQEGLQISGASTSGIKVIGFSGHGAAIADVYITSTVPAATCDLLDTDGVIGYQGTTNGQRLRVKGTGSPSGSVIASPGSQYLSTSGAGAGTTLYVKESGDGSSGWDVLSASTNTIGAQVAYASATSTITCAPSAANTWVAFGSSPSITLPNDSHTYVITATAPGLKSSLQAYAYIGIGTSTSNIYYSLPTFVYDLGVWWVSVNLTGQSVTGTGQTISLYGASSSASTPTISLAAGSSATSSFFGAIELAAYRVA